MKYMVQVIHYLLSVKPPPIRYCSYTLCKGINRRASPWEASSSPLLELPIHHSVSMLLTLPPLPFYLLYLFYLLCVFSLLSLCLYISLILILTLIRPCAPSLALSILYKFYFASIWFRCFVAISYYRGLCITGILSHISHFVCVYET